MEFFVIASNMGAFSSVTHRSLDMLQTTQENMFPFFFLSFFLFEDFYGISKWVFFSKKSKKRTKEKIDYNLSAALPEMVAMEAIH